MPATDKPDQSPVVVDLTQRKLVRRAFDQSANRPGPCEVRGVVQSKPAGVPRSGIGASDTPAGWIAWQRQIASQS